jgi:hypothetical protein
VRKWVRRYEDKREEGLEDLSRKPEKSPFKTSPIIEGRVRKENQERYFIRQSALLYPNLPFI